MIRPMLRERAFAAIYDRLATLEEKQFLGEFRERQVADLEGAVLEIGAGTGLNLSHYRKADRVVLAEPSTPMRARLARAVNESAVPVTVVEAPADDLPYPDASFDAVVSTLVLCTVPDVQATLAEIRRVLEPGGRFLFLEHVRAHDPGLAHWQDRLQPAWTWVGVGCHPNRDLAAAIGDAGFEIDDIEEFDAPGPVAIVRPHILGRATR